MSKLQLKLIKSLLDSNKVEYKIFEHEPIFTTKKAKLQQPHDNYAIKSILLKTKEKKFVLALVSVNRKIDLKKLARTIGTKDLTLANQEEVFKKTGCEIGGVTHSEFYLILQLI